jgi:hypothetical protein
MTADGLLGVLVGVAALPRFLLRTYELHRLVFTV